MHVQFKPLAILLLSGAAAFAPSHAFAQNPPPGAIFDLSTVHPAPLSGSTYTQFTTSFVADNTAEYVSFAFREAPAYFGFDDASITASGSSTNLLADPGFESDTASNVGTNFPVGWFRWIQPVDTSAIGEVSSTSSRYGCSAGGPRTGTYFWCDGSVEGYDALYQELTGLTPGQAYSISWYLTDDSGDPITNPSVDMLVYAGDVLPGDATPIGTVPPPIGPPVVTGATPEPSSLVLLGTGLSGLVTAVRARRRKA